MKILEEDWFLMAKSKRKNNNSSLQIVQKEHIQPHLLKMIDTARRVGFEEGKRQAARQSKIEGMSELMISMQTWTNEIDQHVKGIGPKNKELIMFYYAERIKELIEKQMKVKQ